MLAMRAFLAFLVFLADWLRLPERGGLAELDLQIDKMRKLRDSYQAAPEEQRADLLSKSRSS